MNQLVLCDVETWWTLNVTQEQLEVLLAVARTEGGLGWDSIRLLHALRQECSEGALTEEQTASVLEKLTSWLAERSKEINAAQARGLDQARACLGHFGFLLSKDVDPTRFAAEAIARYVAAYAQFSQGFYMVPASKVKKKTFSDEVCESAVYRLSSAVRSAHKVHPEWPVTCAGLVRLYPRKPRPVTCAAIYVHFEGHGKMAVVWPLE